MSAGTAADRRFEGRGKGVREGRKKRKGMKG